MKRGDLVHVTHSTSGDGQCRRAVFTGEKGILVETRYIGDLTMTSLVWCDVMLTDGMITLPSWCLTVSESGDETG
jgi:hypothetical protein